MRKTNVKPIAIGTITGLVLFCLMQGGVAKDGKQDQLSPLFQSHAPLTLTLNAPFRTIDRYRGDNRHYVAAVLSMSDKDGRELQLALKVRVRGDFRSQRNICVNPPLKLDFKRKSTANTIFAGENKLKLAVQCRSYHSYQQYLLLEYLNYRAYRLLTDESLHVRLATVGYYDSDRKRGLGKIQAFFIEDAGRFAKRMGMQEVHQKKLSPGDYDPARINLVEVFEYFIGNTDWSLIDGHLDEDCCHNIIPLSPKGGGPLIPIPYDFDLTGLVNPGYAQVSDLLPIKNVRQRLYRGFCHDDGVVQATIAKFLAAREAIRALYEKQAGLSGESKRYALRYIDQFYDIIQDQEKLQREIIGKCR